MGARHKKQLTMLRLTITPHNESISSTHRHRQSSSTSATLDYWHDADRDDTPPENYNTEYDIEIGAWED